MYRIPIILLDNLPLIFLAQGELSGLTYSGKACDNADTPIFESGNGQFLRGCRDFLFVRTEACKKCIGRAFRPDGISGVRGAYSGME